MFEGSLIKDNILYPLAGESTPQPDFSAYLEKPFIEYYFDQVRLDLESKGERTWLTNGAKKATGSSAVFGPESCQVGEVEKRSRAYSRVLHHVYKVARGDVVHLLMPNNTQFYFPVLATWMLQGTVSPADPTLSASVLQSQLIDANTKVIFCTRASLDKVLIARDGVEGNVPVIVMDADDGADDQNKSIRSLASFLALDQALDDPPQAQIVEENERSMICWSSGTTGRPKGIQIGSRFWIAKLLEHTSSNFKAAIQTTCFFHMGGFATPITYLIRGTQTFFIDGQDLDQDIKIIYRVAAECEAEFLMCGSHHCISLATEELPEGIEPIESLKVILPVGTNVYKGIMEDMKKAFPSLFCIINVYGQSEIGHGVAMSLSQDNLGGVWKDCEAVKIVNPENGSTMGPNQVGEIASKSNLPMLGYLNHPEENDRFFGKDGFLYSGDLGHYDEEGNLYFDGRIKELIKYKNIHLYPNEIEELIMKMEGVEDAGVVGKPDPKVQELVTAAVVKKDGFDLRKEDIENMVEEKLDDHKKLRGGVNFVEKIPRNPQGKILRKELLELIKKA